MMEIIMVTMVMVMLMLLLLVLLFMLWLLFKSAGHTDKADINSYCA